MLFSGFEDDAFCIIKCVTHRSVILEKEKSTKHPTLLAITEKLECAVTGRGQSQLCAQRRFRLDALSRINASIVGSTEKEKVQKT